MKEYKEKKKKAMKRGEKCVSHGLAAIIKEKHTRGKRERPSENMYEYISSPFLQKRSRVVGKLKIVYIFLSSAFTYRISHTYFIGAREILC